MEYDRFRIVVGLAVNVLVDYADEFEAGLDIILGALPEPSSR